MTTKELIEEVWSLIDEHAMDFGKEEYRDMLLDIADSAKVRAEGVTEELEDEDYD